MLLPFDWKFFLFLFSSSVARERPKRRGVVGFLLDPRNCCLCASRLMAKKLIASQTILDRGIFFFYFHRLVLSLSLCMFFLSFFLFFFFFLLSSGPVEKGGLISLVGRWTDFRSLLIARSMSSLRHNHIRSMPSTLVSCVLEFWPVASNPSTRFNPLERWRRRRWRRWSTGAHYLIENYFALRALVSN